MSRGVLVLDRAVLLVLGVTLLIASAFLVVWGLGRLPAAAEELDLTGLHAVPEHPWWPWVLAVGGVLAVLVGLRSLLAHARRRRVRRIGLPAAPDSPDGLRGRLRLDLPAVAGAAAEALTRTGQVESARGHVVVDRGTTVVELVARVDASADLSGLRAAVDRVRDTLAVVLPPGTAHLRVRLDVRRARVENARVV